MSVVWLNWKLICNKTFSKLNGKQVACSDCTHYCFLLTMKYTSPLAVKGAKTSHYLCCHPPSYPATCLFCTATLSLVCQPETLLSQELVHHSNDLHHALCFILIYLNLDSIKPFQVLLRNATTTTTSPPTSLSKLIYQVWEILKPNLCWGLSWSLMYWTLMLKSESWALKCISIWSVGPTTWWAGCYVTHEEVDKTGNVHLTADD